MWNGWIRRLVDHLVARTSDRASPACSPASCWRRSSSIVAGVAIGRSRPLGDYVEPIIHFVRAIPPPALLPLFLVLLGIGDSMKVALIAVGVFPPILLNTIDGVRSIDPLYLDTARVLPHLAAPPRSPT